MIVTAVCGLFSAVYVGGAFTVLSIPIAVASVLLPYLFTDVAPGTTGGADIVSAVITTTIVGILFIVAGYMIYWRNIESYFSTFPWLAVASETTHKVKERSYQKRCPFTGLRPGFRCPSCQCRVHEKAFHPAYRLIRLPVGETVLRWDLAGDIVEQEDFLSTEKARAALDEALDLRGNTYTQSVSNCCIGCATWQKAFNLAPRLSLSMGLTGVVFAFIPWAFPSFLQLIGQAGVILKTVTACLGVSFAMTGLLLQLRALGRANAFLSWHCGSIPALRPIKHVPQSGWGAVLAKFLFATKWDPLM